MYQFPDSSEVMGYQEPEPLNNSTRYKIIIVANLLLALFIVAIIWFFFFSDSKPNNSVALNQSLITKSVYHDTQHSTGDYTPIITNDADPIATTPSAESNNISIIAAVQNNKEKRSSVDVITNEIEKSQRKKREMIALDNEKIKPTQSVREINKKEQLSLKSGHTLLAINRVERSSTTETNQSATAQPLSAVDLITNELMKKNNEKLDKNQAGNKIALSNDSVLKEEVANKSTLAEQTEKMHIEKNQVVIKHPIEQPLISKIAKIRENLAQSNQQLATAFVEKPQLASTDVTKTTLHRSKDTAIYNSISLKKESDIDRIMLAMGSVERPAEEKAADKIEATIKKLLKNSEIKPTKTDFYVKKLQSESDENKKEVRTITVKQGETLWDIAVRAYGDGNKYKILLEANPVLKKNPKLIKAGITLRAPL